MSTILEALRKLQQDGERANKNKTSESGSPDSSQPAPHSAGASGQGDEPRADRGEEPTDRGGLPGDGSRGVADLPELIDKIERMLGKNREPPPLSGTAADISAKVTPANEVVAPPEVTEPLAQAEQRGTATPVSTEPESEEDLQRADSRARGLRQDWLSLLDREPDPASSERTGESDEAEAQFTPIEDPETLDAFMKLPAADVSAASPDTSLRPAQAAPTMGGNWRDHQAEPFSGAAAPYPSDAPSTAGGHTLGTTEARLLASFEGASEASEDEEGEPSIYIDAGDVGVESPSRLRNIATATVALAVGLFAGFLVVKAMIGGPDGADDQIATLPSVEQRAAVRAAAKVKNAATTMDGDAGAGSGGAKGVEHTKEKKKQGKGKKAQVKPLAKTAKARPAVKAADSVAPLRAAAAPTGEGPRSAGRPATAKPAPPAKPGVVVAPATPVAVAKAKPVPTPMPTPMPTPVPAGPEPLPEPQISLTIPPGAPHVDLVFVQWARQSTKRLVSLRNLKGTLLVLREGDYADAAQGMKVSSIGHQWVDFEWKANRFRILINDF